MSLSGRLCPCELVIMKFTRKTILLAFLNIFLSTSVQSDCQECCEDLFLLKNHFVIKKRPYGLKSQLSIQCSKNNETNIFPYQKSCNLSSKIFHEFITDCSIEELLVFSNEYPRTSSHVKVLEFNLYHNEDKIIRITQNIFSLFKHLEELSFLHANVELDSNDIVWPKKLTVLSIHNR